MTVYNNNTTNPVRFWPIVVMMAIVGVVVLALVAAPWWGQIRLRTHAVEKHGNDALMARLVNRTCAPLAWFCPGSGYRPPRFYLVCVESGGKRCAVTVVTTEKNEATSFTTSCDKIFSQVALCQVTTIQEVIDE